MAFTNRIAALAASIFFMNYIGLVLSLDMAYCASINTASTASNSSTWQSDGLCHDFCSDGFAFSVVKGDDCWCSDYVPDESTQVDTSECNTQCPGYPDDTCGGNGLWGYMAQAKDPAGTKGSSGTTQTSTPETTGSSSGRTTSLTASVATVTVGGTVSLQTVYATPTNANEASSDANSSGMTSSHEGLSTAQAVGVAIGVLGAMAIAIAIGVLICLRRRRRQGDVIGEGPGSHRGSSAGMMSTPTTGMASVWDGDNTSGRRNSRYMPHDPRMDPYATNIYSRFENKSHESINTLQDNHDYSRKVLRTTNPDPADRE